MSFLPPCAQRTESRAECFNGDERPTRGLRIRGLGRGFGLAARRLHLPPVQRRVHRRRRHLQRGRTQGGGPGQVPALPARSGERERLMLLRRPVCLPGEGDRRLPRFTVTAVAQGISGAK